MKHNIVNLKKWNNRTKYKIIKIFAKMYWIKRIYHTKRLYKNKNFTNFCLQHYLKSIYINRKCRCWKKIFYIKKNTKYCILR